MLKLSLETEKDKAKSLKFFFAGFLLSVLAAGIGFISMGIWPFGNKILLIIDSLHQYLPFYTDLQSKLSGGQSLMYSFSGGLGYNLWSTIAYYMASPVNLLMAFIQKEHVCDFMDLMILLKIGLCGGCFSWYLHKKDENRKYLPVIFGMTYALSNFVIGYYFNLMWLDSIAMLPLIMYGIERIVKGGSGRLFGFSLFYALWCNYYIGFMLCIFSCLYFLVRWISADPGMINKKRIGKSCFTFGSYALLAGGMAAVILVPAYMGLATSESMQENSFPSVIRFYTGLGELLQSHLVFLEPINISDSQVGLNAYCGIFTVFLAVLYLFDRRVRMRERLAHMGLVILLWLSFAMNIFNYIWHGFHQQNGLPNRFAFIYIAVLLIMAYDAVGHLWCYRFIELLAAFLIPAIFILYRFLLPEKELEGFVYIISLGFLLVYFGILLLGRYVRSVNYVITSVLIAVVALIEISSNALYAINCNGGVTRDIYIADQTSCKALMDKQDETGFFRSEVDRQRMRNVTMYCGGNPLVMFNSTMHQSVIDFCDSLGIEARTNKNGYQGVTKLMNDVLGIRYLASPVKKADSLYQFRKVGEDGELTLYKNEDALSLGFVVNEDIVNWDISEGKPLEVQNRFVELATGHAPIYGLDRTIDMEDGENYGIKIPDNKQVYVSLDTRISKLEVNTPEYEKNYSDYTDHLYAINAVGSGNMADITPTLKSSQKTVEAEIYTCPNAAYQEVLSTLSERQLMDLEVSGNRVKGKLEAGKAGMLLLTIPYDEGWKIKVDGKKTDYCRIGGALLGVSVDEGSHTIDMNYTPPGFAAGCLLTILSVALVILLGIWERKNKHLFIIDTEDETMEFQFSRKAEQLEAGIFAVLNEKKNELSAQGMTIYNLSVGTPDFKPARHIMDAVSEAAKKPENYKYSLVDIPELLDAAQRFFKRRFAINLKTSEIMTMYGSQEGMAHITWALCDPGDLVLVPNPGYPIFKVGPQLCDAEVWEYPLYPETGFLPDLKAIPEDIAFRAKFMLVSYPGNPCCKLAPDSFYEELIAFAKKYSIFILHDNAYADLVYGRQGNSFLNYEGAKEVGVEFYSLSKTFNYTGARLSFAIGNEEIIRRFRALRTQFDYGIFLPVQYGAIAALNGPFDGVLRQCDQYAERSRVLCSGLREIGWEVPDSEATMFVWAPLPEGYKNSEKFVLELMERSGVIVVPGSSFGSLGEGYVRFALVLPPEKLKEAVNSIAKSGMIRQPEISE